MNSNKMKYMPILDLLTKASPHLRQNLLSSADEELIKLLVECCFNTLIGGVRISKYRHNKIKQHKDIIRQISNPNQKLENKRKILIQSGGNFLPVFLPAVIPTLKSFSK